MKFDYFEELIYSDLAWRKKEISELYLLTSDKKNEVLLKSMILVLYSHWEGYIKKSSKLYIRYIIEKKINICDLTHNFKAIALKRQITNAIDAGAKLNLNQELEFMEKYNKMQCKDFKVKIDVDDEFDKSIINTHDNLNPKVFKNILNILGISYVESLSSRENYMDSYLLGNRNAIGHGSKINGEKKEFDLGIDEITELKVFIVELLDFHTKVMLEYLKEEYYLEVNISKRELYDEQQNEEFEKILRKIDEQYSDIS